MNKNKDWEEKEEEKLKELEEKWIEYMEALRNSI